MILILKVILFLTVLVFVYQLYNYAMTRKEADKEPACYGFGISYMVLGVLCFIFRGAFFSFLGLLLLMLGLLLLANGLQRRNKTIFIDRYDGSRKE